MIYAFSSLSNHYVRDVGEVNLKDTMDSIASTLVESFFFFLQ